MVDPLSVGDRVAAEVSEVPSARVGARGDAFEVGPVAVPEEVNLPEASAVVLGPGEVADGVVLRVDAPSDAEIVTQIGSLPALSVGRADLVLADTDAVGEDSRVVVQTLPLAEESLPGAVVAFRVRALDGADDQAWARLTVDASGFEHAFGADYGSRLRLVEFPECALTTPEVPSCVTGVDLAEVVEEGVASPSGFVELDVPQLPGGGAGVAVAGSGSGSIIAAVSGASGATGTFTATDLGADSQWQVSEQYGSFAYSVPLRLPTVPVGPVPDVTVSYNSGAVDGQGLSTNNQPGWVGQGWSLGTPYVERLYKGCAADGYTARGAELCWDSPYEDEPGLAAYVLSFGGSTQQLIWDGGNRYRTQAETGWRMVRETRSTSPNGDNDGEYFKLMLPDGSVYFFGLGYVPQTGQADVDTNSVATVPVYGDDTGEPRCGSAQSSYCMQGYRWMLDLQEDANNNAITYFYAPETNRYALGGDPSKSVTYTSALVPSEIRYGATTSTRTTGYTAKVVFTTKSRCVETANGDYDALGGDAEECLPATVANASSYPDTPLDLRCTGTCTSAQDSPVFFTFKRLNYVSAFAKVGASNWDTVVRHQFEFTYPSTDDGGARALWLKTIQSRYYGDTADPDDNITDYVYAFGGTNLNNRVDYTSAVRAMDKQRLTTVKTPDGLTISVSYQTQKTSANNHCPTTGSSGAGFTSWYASVDENWDDNEWDCAPQLFTPAVGATGFAIFHRYLVDEVVLDDAVMDTPSQTLTYTYVGNPAWGYQNSILFSAGAGNQTWNSWRGYEKVRVTTGSGATESTTTTQYHRGMDGDHLSGSGTRSVSITPINDDRLPLSPVADTFARQGLVIGSVTEDAGEVIRSRTQNVYVGATVKDGPGVYKSAFIAVEDAYVLTRLVNKDDGFRSYRTAKTHTEYDVARRVKSVLTAPDTDDAALTSCATYSYAQSASAWGEGQYVVVPTQVMTTKATCAGITTGRTDLFYDGATTAAANIPVNGNVTKEVTYATSAATGTASTASYDTRGRIVTATLPDGVSKSKWAYGTESGMTKVTYTNAPNVSETAWFDPVFGNTMKVKRVNGLFDHYRYDAAGRPKEEFAAAQYGDEATPPATTKASTTFLYDSQAAPLERRTVPNQIRTRVLKDVDGNADSLRTYTLYDAFGNEVQTSSPRQDGGVGRVVVVKSYDSVGNLVVVSSPLVNPNPVGMDAVPASSNPAAMQNYTLTTYDWAGRPTKVEHKSLTVVLSKTTSTYFGDGSLVQSPSTRTVTMTDGAGRTVSTVTGDGTVFTKATYAYESGADGTVTTVKDAANVKTVFTADRLGRTVRMVDPNAGETSYQYDTNGRVEKVTSQAGVVRTTYDALGRALTRTTYGLESATTAQSTTTYTYDTSGSVTSPGQLLKTEFTFPGATTSYKSEVTAVHPRTQLPTATKVTLPTMTGLGAFSGKDYTTTVAYDDSGRVTSTTLPAVAGFLADEVTTGYTSFGAVNSLTSTVSGPILTSVTRKFDGRVTGRSLANSVSRSLVWDEGYRRVTGVVATAGGALVQGDTYEYDTAGRVHTIADAVTHVKQCYTYDDGNRLSAAWTQTAVEGSPACASSAPTDGTWNVTDEPSSYRSSWKYDPAGQISSAVTATFAAPTPSTTTYEYCNLTHPNAVTFTSNATAPDAALCVTATHDADLANVNVDAGAYEYDAAGRMTSRPNPTGSGTQTLSWDVLSNLTTITPIAADGTTGVATTYLYDAAGQRFAALTGTTATIYMGSWEATDSNTGANPATGADDISVTRFYSAGGVQLASKTTGGQLLITLGDVQGSAQVTVDPTGVTTSNAYTPYGVKRDGSTVASAHGWLNQIADPTGLTYLNARYYDPVLGRFISPDPLMNPADPRTLDPYRYADNNPIVYTDATGLNPGCQQYTGKDFTTCFQSYGDIVQPAYKKMRDEQYAAAYAARKTTVDGKKLVILGVSVAAGIGCGFVTLGTAALACAGGTGSAISALAYGINTPQDQWTVKGYTVSALQGAAVGLVGWGLGQGASLAIKSAAAGAVKTATAPATNTGVRSFGGFGQAELRAAAQAADRNGLTQVGRALQKHSGRDGSVFNGLSNGTATARNQQGLQVLDEILADTGGRTEVLDRVTNIWDSTGRGVRFSNDGSFMGFLEPLG
ncbi:RHS repeat-associated core domain-containing protein [Demequina sp.]|uniref:RHS repeat domain-containing protein n=1 Tax=Demequina sp. TaxID=2050685 RepID=UPI003D11C40F